jgi:hypothetical protein
MPYSLHVPWSCRSLGVLNLSFNKVWCVHVQAENMNQGATSRKDWKGG